MKGDTPVCATSERRGGAISKFVLMLAKGAEYRSWIHEINLGPNPSFCKTVNKYCHSTRSNAFSASNEMTISGT